jgi:hypothetical protein
LFFSLENITHDFEIWIMMNPLDPKFHTSDTAGTKDTLGITLAVQEISFLQAGNANSPILLDLSQTMFPTGIIEHIDFSLALTLVLNQSRQATLLQHRDQLICCQIQAFATPLSPIRRSQPWESSLSTALFLWQKHYRVEFQPISMSQGIYRLQLLILINHLRTSPVLWEIPAFSVIKPTQRFC